MPPMESPGDPAQSEGQDAYDVASMLSRRVAAALCVLACVSAWLDAQWPQFRGPNGSGIARRNGLPDRVFEDDERRMEDCRSVRPVILGHRRHPPVPHWD